jgi:hypothetical protein
MFAFGSTSNFHVFEIDTEKANNSDDEEEKTQERLAKRFAKRARMQRLEESHAESEEFSQQRLIDEDETMKLELKKMKVGTSFSLLHISRFIATILTRMLILSSEWPCSKEKRFLGFQKLLLFNKRVVPTGFISIQAPAQYWKFWRVLLSNGGRQPLPCLADESREEQN